MSLMPIAPVGWWPPIKTETPKTIKKNKPAKFKSRSAAEIDHL